MRKLLILGFALLATGLGVLFMWNGHVLSYLNTPMQKDSQPFYYQFASGSNLRHLVRDMEAKKVLQRPEYLWFYALLNDRTRSLKSGIYYITPQKQSPLDLLDMLQKGGVAEFKFRTQEGHTFKKMMRRVAGNDNLVQILDEASPEEIMAAIGHAGKPYEGQFYPDTYRLPLGYTDVEFLMQSYKKQQEVLAEEWANRQENLPLKTPYEALILASIIEKETNLGKEKPIIASVFFNRLKKGMRLQTDPTIIYGMGDAFKGNLTRKDLRTPTPYNTYIIKGLPPTPISMPARATLHAALHPAETKALFFVAKGDGTHQFSNTYAAHKKAVRKYQIEPYKKRVAARKAKREAEKAKREAEKAIREAEKAQKKPVDVTKYKVDLDDKKTTAPKASDKKTRSKKSTEKKPNNKKTSGKKPSTPKTKTPKKGS